MESAYMTLPEIIDLFKIRGFNEKDLGLDAKPGMIGQSIKNAYLVAAGSSSSKNDVENFFLDLTGRFDDKNDKVSFRFDFCYNNETRKLRVKALRAVMDESKKLYFFANTHHLIHSQEAYSDLTNIRIKKVLELHPKIIRQPVLQKSIHL